MPKVRLRWIDGRETIFDLPDPNSQMVLVLPGDDGKDHSFHLVSPDPPDPAGLPVYQEKPLGN